MDNQENAFLLIVMDKELNRIMESEAKHNFDMKMFRYLQIYGYVTQEESDFKEMLKRFVKPTMEEIGYVKSIIKKMEDK